MTSDARSVRRALTKYPKAKYADRILTHYIALLLKETGLTISDFYAELDGLIENAVSEAVEEAVKRTLPQQMFTEFEMFVGPSHSWLKVHEMWLRRLKMGKDISRHSYVDGRWIYLEEDRDATLFVQAFGSAYPHVEIVINEQETDEKRIRSLSRYGGKKD